MSSRPDAHLSTVPSIRTSDRQASSVRTTCFFRPDTYIVLRSFCASLLHPDVSAARPDAYQFLNGSLILSKFQEREDQSTVWTMWYPVRTRISVRQESQFKMNRPDIRQLWSGRWCIVYGNCRFDFNRPDVSLSWSGRTRIRYGNCVLKFSRPDARSLLWKLLAADVRPSGRSSHPVRTMFLYRKDFSVKISENPVAQLSVRTAMVHRPDGPQAYFA
jgi:hypothetical protein